MELTVLERDNIGGHSSYTINLFKNSQEPYSSEIYNLDNKIVDDIDDVIDMLEDLSWKDNFVYEVIDGWGNQIGWII